MPQERRKLGLRSTVAIVAGGMVGSAIFSLSGLTIAYAGPSAVLSWVIAGLILLSYGLLCAELSAMCPNSGGVFVFPAKFLGRNERQGRLWGWIATWAYLFGCLGGASFAAIYLSYYLGMAIPALSALQAPIAVAAVLLCGALNIFRIGFMGKANIALTCVLTVTLLAFIGVALFSGKWSAAGFAPFFTQGSAGGAGFIRAIPVAMVAYGSIVSAAFMVGEIRDPSRTIPKAMRIAMTAVILFYVLIIVTVLGLLPSRFLQEHADVALIPLYAAAGTALPQYPWLTGVISVAAVAALTTSILILTTLSARVLQAAAQSGALPQSLARSNSRGTPVRAILVMTACFAALAAFPNMADFIVNMGALCNGIVISAICVTSIAARRKAAPERPAALRNLQPILTLAVIIACYVPGILRGGWQLWAITAGYFAVGMLMYAAFTRRAPEAPREEIKQWQGGCAQERAMQYISGKDFVLNNTCVVFGFFDGVHAGHRAALACAADEARREGLTSVALSFDRDSAGPAQKLLSTEAEKRFLIEKAEAPDVMISYPFEADMEPARFISDVLVGRLGTKVVVAGKNCAWLDELNRAVAQYGFRLAQCDLACAQGAPVTAGRVREALAASDIPLASALLGHPYLILGTVEHGKHLGRTVGMPTANISYLPCKQLPPEGAFGTRTAVDGDVLWGVTNIGRRPSVDNLETITVENHLFDFSGNLYGKQLSVEIHFFIRGVHKFKSLEEVKANVSKDISFARQRFGI